MPADATCPAKPTVTPPGLKVECRRNPEWRRTLVRRVRGEFLDMPGLHLTLMQARRLFGLRLDVCERILLELVRDGFLTAGGNGVFARR